MLSSSSMMRIRFRSVPAPIAPSSGPRQHQGEGAAIAAVALHVDVPAVRLHDVLDDGKAEAGALALPREPVVDSIELLEDPFVLRGLDTLAVVLDRYADL